MQKKFLKTSAILLIFGLIFGPIPADAMDDLIKDEINTAARLRQFPECSYKDGWGPWTNGTCPGSRCIKHNTEARAEHAALTERLKYIQQSLERYYGK